MKARVKRIFQAAPDGVEAIVLANSEAPHLDLSFFHATDLVEGGLFEGGFAVLRRDGSLTVLTNELEEQSAQKAKDAEVLVYHGAQERMHLLQKAVGGAQRVGYHGRETTFAAVQHIQKALPGVVWEDVSRAMLRARLVKDKTEVARIRKACQISSRVAEEIPDMLATGMSEADLSAEMNARMQRYGAAGPSFATIVAFGENAAEPHYAPGPKRKLAGKDYVLCDFGAQYQLYAADITRTYVYGQANKKQREVYELVQRAQQVGFDAVKPGVKAGEVHEKVAEVIDRTKYKGRFIHSTGHSLGLSVHDGGRIAAGAETVLEEGMVFTVEPGIYLPGWGGVRIEDDVLVTRKGYELLTTATRELLEVPLAKAGGANGAGTAPRAAGRKPAAKGKPRGNAKAAGRKAPARATGGAKAKGAARSAAAKRGTGTGRRR